MDPELVAVIEEYLRAHGMNTPSPEVMSDLVAGVGSTIDGLLATLGLAANIGDPADNADAQLDQADRDANLLDAETKFPANEAQSAQLMQTLPQTAAGIAGAVGGVFSGLLQGLVQIPQQAAQGAQQALQAGLGVAQQTGAGLVDDAVPETDPEADFLDDPGEPGWDDPLGGGAGDGAGDVAGGGGGAPGELEGTNPTGYLGPPPTPSPVTAPAAAQTFTATSPNPPAPAAGTRGGFSPMPMVPPGGMYGTGATGETKTDTKRVVAPSVRNGAPVQGRITVPPPAVTRRVDAKPLATRRVLAPGGEDDAREQ